MSSLSFNSFARGVQTFWVWQYGTDDDKGSFAVELINLYFKADEYNKEKLGFSFPFLKKVYNSWIMDQNYGDDLFRRHGHPIPGSRNKMPREIK